MAKFHRGLRKNLVAGYLANVNRIVDEHLAQLPQTGEFEVFAYMKALVHRIGFLCWVGPLALQPKYFTRLVSCQELFRFSREGGVCLFFVCCCWCSFTGEPGKGGCV